MQRCFVVEQKIIQIMLLIENYLIIWFYTETKDFHNEFRVWNHNGAIRQAFSEPYGFVPPCSVDALLLYIMSVLYLFRMLKQNLQFD